MSVGDVIFWINVIVLAATLILLAVNVRQTRAFRRKLHEQDVVLRSLEVQKQELCDAIDTAYATDQLLTKLCADSFHRTTLPAWKAWGGTMGDIRISVEMVRYSFDAEEEE